MLARLAERRPARRPLAVLVALALLALTVVAVPPRPVAAVVDAAADDAGCTVIWTGPTTGNRLWDDASNWSRSGSPTVPESTDVVCFGAEFGGTAVARPRIRIENVATTARVVTDADAEIVLFFGTLVASEASSIDGVFLDGAMYEFGASTLPAGGRAGSLSGGGTFRGPLTIDAGGEVTGPTLRFEGSVANAGTIRSTFVPGTFSSSVRLVDATYSGNGVLAARGVTLQQSSSFAATADSQLEVGSLGVLDTSSASLAAVDIASVTVDGRLTVGGQVTTNRLVLREPGSIELVGGALFEPAEIAVTGTATIGGDGTVRPDLLTVSATGNVAFRGEAASTAVMLDPALRVTSSRRWTADRSELRVAHRLAPVDPESSVAVVPAGRLAAAPGDPAVGLTLAGDVRVEITPDASATIDRGAVVTMFDSTTLDLGGRLDLNLDAGQRPFGTISPGQTLRLDGCIAFSPSFTTAGERTESLAIVDGGDVTFDAVVAAVAPFPGAGWQLEGRSNQFDLRRTEAMRAQISPVEVLIAARDGVTNQPECPPPAGSVRVSSDSVEIPEDSDPIGLTVTIDNSTGAPVTITPELTGTGAQPLEADDVSVSPSSIVAPVGTSTHVLQFLPSPDGIHETDESGEVRFGAAVAGSVAVTVIDDDPRPTVVAVDGLLAALEGDAIVLQVIGSGPTEVPVSVPFSVDPLTGDVTDFVALGQFGVIRIGEPFALVSFEDDIPEGAESVRITIGGVPVEVTVFEDDFLGDRLELVAPAEPVAEGRTATVQLRFPSPAPSGVTLSWSAEQDSSVPVAQRAELGADFAPEVHPLVQVPVNALSIDFDVPVLVDAETEGAERFVVEVRVDGMLQPLRVPVVIAADPTDEPPTVTVLSSEVDVREGDPVRLELSVSGDVGTTPLEVPFTVEAVGATGVTPAADFDAASGTIVIEPTALQDPLRPGEVAVSLPTVDDDVFEGSEQFRIVLGEPIGATLAAGTAAVPGTIADDELAPVISARFREASLAEGGSTVVEVRYDAATEPAERPLDVTLDFAAGTPPVAFDTDVTVVGTTTLADGTRRVVVRLTNAAPLATVAVQTVEDAVAETVERLNASASALTVAGAVFPIRRSVASDSLTVRDDDGDVSVGVGVEPFQGTEGQTLQLHVTAGVNDIDGDVAVVVEFAAPSSELLVAGDPATDIRVGGDVLPGNRRFTVPVPRGLTEDARIPIELVDDSLAEEIETIAVRIVAVTVGGSPRGFTPSAPGANEAEVVIVDDDDRLDEEAEAEQVQAFREGMLDLPDLIGSWAGLFDFTPGAWDGTDPVDLPVGADRLATLAEVGPAAVAATAGTPLPTATDRTWEAVVRRLTDPNDNGTPNEPDEGACDVVHVVRGIAGFPDAPDDGVIEVRCDLTLGDLIEQSNGGTLDQWNDETEAMRELAEFLALDADDGLSFDMSIQLVFGLDAQSFYVRATTGFDARLHGALNLTGEGTVLGVEDVVVDGGARIDVRLLLGPGGAGKLRGAQLTQPRSDLLEPEVRGSASADLSFTRDDDDFEWNGSWALQTPVDGDPLVELDEQRLRVLLQVDGLETGLVDRPDQVLVEGTFANGFWTLEGSLDDASINSFVVDHAEFTAIVDATGIFRADAEVELVVNEATDDPVEVTVRWERDRDSWSMTGTVPLGDRYVKRVLYVTGAEVVVNLGHDGTNPTGSVRLNADTAVVFPIVGDDDPEILPGVPFTPRGLLTLTDVTGAIVPGGVSLTAGTVAASIRGGAVSFEAENVTVRLGSTFADQPALAIAELSATFRAMPTTLVTVTGLQVLQDGRVGAASAEVDRADGFFDGAGIDDILPFSVTNVRLDFADTVPGTDPPLRALDAFDVTVTGSFDQDEMADWPFTPQIQLGGEVVTPTSDPDDNTFTFSVAVESLAEGVVRPLDLGPIGFGFEDVEVGRSELDGFISFDGWVDGELQPGLTGELVLARGVDTDDENSKRATISGTMAPGRVDIDAEFAITGRYGNLDVTDLELAFAMQFGLDAAGETYATFDLDTLSVGESSLSLGPWARVTLGDASFDFDAAADEPALVVLGDPSDPTSGLGVEFLAEFDELEGWGGRVGGITVCGDGSIHLTEQTFVTLRVPEGERMGLPEELPVRIDEAGLIFDVPAADPDEPCTGGDISDITDVIVRFSGGIEAQGEWPLSFDVEGLEVSLARLTGLQSGFPIVNLDEITIGLEQQELPGGITFGGQLTLGQVPVDGRNVFYLQLQGSVGVSGIEFGGNVVITQHGPVIMSLQAPVGIPIGPTGLVLSSVAAGVQFGVELPSIDDPIELLGLQISPVDADVDRAAIVAAIRPVLNGGSLWDRPFSIAGTGFITSIASPGMAGGEVTFGLNVGFSPGDGAKLFARGDLNAFGIPVGGGGIYIDLDNPVEPIIDVAFAVPGPQAGPISFVMPSEGTFTMRIDTTGVAPAAAIAVRTFFSEVVNGTVEVGGAAFSQALTAMAAELNSARHRPLAQFLLDVNGDGVVSAAEDAVPLTSAMLTTRLLALLPSSPGAAAALLASHPDLLTAVIGELLIALDGVSVGGEVPADLLAAFGEGQRTMAAFVAMVSRALRNAGAEALRVFNPSVTITGSLQPMILGIPFGEPEAAGTLTINREGITVGYTISVSKLIQRLGEMIIPFVGGELVSLLSVGAVDTFDLTAQLPFGGFVESLVTGTVAPRVDPNDGRWAITGQGRLGLLGYEMVGSDLLITAPQNQRFVDDEVQLLFDPVTGEPLDISPVEIDEDRIPIVNRADYENLLKYGGILISGRVQIPGMIVDPATLISRIGPVSADPAGALPWLRQVAETVTAPATPVRGTLFLPSPQILLTQQLDAIGDDRFSVNTAAATFVADAREWLRAASFNGVYEGMFMSIPAFKATVRGTITGLSINGVVPLIGARATFQVGMRQQPFAGGVVLPIPTVELRLGIDPTSEGSLVDRLGVPEDLRFVQGSLELRILSPGFDPSSLDSFERQGGIRVTAQADVEGIVDDAEVVVAVLFPSNPLAGEDFDLEVRADELGIVGFGITDPELVFRKRGFVVIGELRGRLTVLGAAASVDGTFDTATGGSLEITFDSGDGPTLSGFNLSADATLELTQRPNAIGYDVAVSFTGEAVLPSWLSNASGRARATVSGCVDPSGDAEFVVSLAEFGFGASLPNGQRRVTIGARQGQTAGQPAAACTLPAGATVTPGGAVVRLRRDNGVSSVFVDGQMRFNDPLMFMPTVGVTGSFDSTGVGTLTVTGSVNLLGSTLTIGSTVTVTRAAGATGTLTLSTPPNQPLTLGGWAVGGTLSLTLTQNAATVGITNGTLTIPGAGTQLINGSISVRGEGSFTVELPPNGLRLGPSPSPFFATGAFTIRFQNGVGTFRATNAGVQVRVGTTVIADPNVPLFEVSSDGTLNVDTAGFTFVAPGGFSLVVPPMSLRSGPSMGGVRLEVGQGQLTLPGITGGNTGRPTLTVPGFTLDSTLDFQRVLAASNLSLGIVTIRGQLVFQGNDGVFSLRIDPVSPAQPAEVRLGANAMQIDSFVIASNGTFDVDVLVRQFGPDALSIRDLNLSMSKTGTSLSTFSASLTGGRLFLPMGEPIPLPELTFDADSVIDRPFTVPGIELGPFFRTSSASFRLRQMPSGIFRLEATNTPTVTALADSVGIRLLSLVVESDGTFTGSIEGQIGLFGRRLRTATMQLSNVGGVLRARLGVSEAVEYDLLFARMNLSGDFFSDGRFSYTGTLTVPTIDLVVFRIGGSVSVTVANTGITGSFSGTACVAPFPCVSASGTMSATGFVESQVKVDTNGNGIPDRFFDVDFQIGAAPGDADTTRPTMATPAAITVRADIPAGRTSTRVQYTTPTATDASGSVAVVCTPPSGTDFAVGNTTVTCRATDRAGNTRTRSFTVTVVDTSPNPAPLPQFVAGAAVTQTGSGFAAGAAVRAQLFSDPVELGTQIADANGDVSFTFTIPADTPPGEHTIVLEGEDPNGDPLLVTRPIEVLPSTDGGTTTTTTPPNGSSTTSTSTTSTTVGTTDPPTATTSPYPKPGTSLPGPGFEPGPGTVTTTTSPTNGSPTNDSPTNDSPTTSPTTPGAASPGSDPAIDVPVRFVGLVPQRLLDTREGSGPLAGGSVRSLVVAGRGGVPADARAVVVNVTATGARAAGFLTVFPCGRTRPATSSVNFVAGETVPAMVTTAVGADGAICIAASATTDVVVDVGGAYSATAGTGTLEPVTPVRLLDTRDGTAAAGGSVTRLRVPGAGAASGVGAVVLDVAAVDPARAGYVTVFPCGERPLASNVNHVVGETSSNAATTAVSAQGEVCLFASAPTDLVVDLMARYVDGAAQQLRSMDTRVLDTRTSAGGRFAAGEMRSIAVAAPGEVVVLNVTSDGAANAGFATVFPCGTARPFVSTLDVPRTRPRANAAVVRADASGRVCVYSSVSTDLVLDVTVTLR